MIIKITNKTKIDGDGQFRIRITNKLSVINFFHKIGTSNIKHIIRFLLWRLKKYEAKIEKEGLSKLSYIINKETGRDIRKVELPFLWINENKAFSTHVQEDLEYVKALKIRKNYKWNEITKELIKIYSAEYLAKKLNIGSRSIRRWRDNSRIPSVNFINNLIKIVNNSDLELKTYKMQDG